MTLQLAQHWPPRLTAARERETSCAKHIKCGNCCFQHILCLSQRKGGRSSHHGDGQGKSQDGEDDEKDGGGDDDDHTREATASKGETHPQGGSNSNDAEEDNSSVQEDPSGIFV